MDNFPYRFLTRCWAIFDYDGSDHGGFRDERDKLEKKKRDSRKRVRTVRKHRTQSIAESTIIVVDIGTYRDAKP